MLTTQKLKTTVGESMVQILLTRRMPLTKKGMQSIFGEDFEKKVVSKSFLASFEYDLIFEENGQLYASSFDISSDEKTYLIYPFDDTGCCPMDRDMVDFYQHFKNKQLSFLPGTINVLEKMKIQEEINFIEEFLNHPSVRLRALFFEKNTK